eukprot:g2579.t1
MQLFLGEEPLTRLPVLSFDCIAQSQGENPLCYFPEYFKEVKTDDNTVGIFRYANSYSLKNSEGNDLVAWTLDTGEPLGVSKDDNKTTITTTDLIYFHGNGENKAKAYFRYVYFARMLMSLEKQSKNHKQRVRIHTFDYRGFGDSEGVATEKGMYNDTWTWWNHLQRNVMHKELLQSRKNAKSRIHRIFLYGHSLGTVAATELLSHIMIAHEKDVLPKSVLPHGMILEAPLLSAVDICQSWFYLSEHICSDLVGSARLDTVGRIKALGVQSQTASSSPRILILHGKKDEVIPFDHGTRLAMHCGDLCDFVFTNSSHHNNLILTHDVRLSVQSFLQTKKLK